MNRGEVLKPPERPKVFSEASIHNRFDIEVIDSETGCIRQRAQAFNVICENFWRNLSVYFNYIAYGSGSGTPSASDTSLFNGIGVAQAQSHTIKNDLALGVSYRTKKITLDETTAVGATITEVGLAYAQGTQYITTHAMLQDMSGNQISITKSSTDIITIYATVFVHWSPSGQNGVYLEKPGRDILVPIMGYLLGMGYSLSSGYYAEAHTYVGRGTTKMHRAPGIFNITFDGATKKLRSIMTRLPVGEGNTSGGFGFVSLKDAYYGDDPYQVVDVRGSYEVTSEAVGTGDGVARAFATKFDLPREAVVKVDGITMNSGVTVYEHPLSSNAAEYFCFIEDVLHNGKPCIRGGAEPIDVGASCYYYNPLHEFGVYSFALTSGCTFALSEDLVTWTKEFSEKSVIPSEYRQYRYIRVTRVSGSSTLYPDGIVAEFPSGLNHNNIVFEEPPAAGSVITIDYVTPFVPKDENHVYDLSFALQLGEYSG